MLQKKLGLAKLCLKKFRGGILVETHFLGGT